MDELTPLRNTRDKSRTPTPDALARGRAALLHRAASARTSQTSRRSRDQEPRRAQAGRVSGRPRWVAPALAVALIVAVVGVAVPFAFSSNKAPSGSAAGLPVSTPAATAAPDGVTKEVYEAGYAAFKECMQVNGSGLGAEYMDGPIHQYSYPASDTAFEECYRPFGAIDADWQVENSYETRTYIRYRQCLADLGVTPASDSAGVEQQIVDNGLVGGKCSPQPLNNPYRQQPTLPVSTIFERPKVPSDTLPDGDWSSVDTNSSRFVGTDNSGNNYWAALTPAGKQCIVYVPANDGDNIVGCSDPGGGLITPDGLLVEFASSPNQLTPDSAQLIGDTLLVKAQN